MFGFFSSFFVGLTGCVRLVVWLLVLSVPVSVLLVRVRVCVDAWFLWFSFL